MSYMKKVLPLVACGCICLVSTTSASACFTGVKTVNKVDEDTDFLCFQGNGPDVTAQAVGNPDFASLTVCNVFATFDDPTDRLLNVGNASMQVFDGLTPAVFFQHSAFFLASVASAYPCGALGGGFPDLICDTYVTIGLKCVPAGFVDGTFPDDDFFFIPEFQSQGTVLGGWANGTPTNGQGDAGNDPNNNNQVLFFQSSVPTGHSLSGDIDIFWLDSTGGCGCCDPGCDPDDCSIPGETIAEENVEILCAAKCIEGDPCDDLNPCTGNPGPDGDTCTNGICTGAPVDCSGQGGQCNTAACDEDGLHGNCDDLTPVENGDPCDDGDECTLTDTCQDGDCDGSNPVICTPSDDCHLAGTCDPDTGICSDPEAPNGTGCDDGDECTLTDECQAGNCEGSNPVICTPSDQCHLAGTCDPADGSCSDPEAPNGTGCDDGDECTLTDECQAGNCEGSNPVICTPSDQCHDAGTCDPDTGNCSDPNSPNGTPCIDGINCTELDVCTDGNCAGTDVDCSGLDDDCNNGVCDEATGMCEAIPKPLGTPCDDEDPCTENEVCTDGDVQCAGSDVDCSGEGDECNNASCDPNGDNGNCAILTPKPEGEGCDDLDACTNGDTCSGGSCSGIDQECPPGAQCNPDNGECEFCETDDDCNALDDDCNDGVCDPATGCFADPKPNGTGCIDGDACTQTDTCQDGQCEGSNPVVCTASDQCHDVGTCDPTTGECSDPEKPNGTPCNDEDNCTNDDECTDGSCDGIEKECPEGEICDPGSGDCVEAPTGSLDIIPGKCPNRLREHGLGFLKVALVSALADPDLGTEAFDACDVKISSLLMVNASQPDCGGAVAPRMSPRPMCKDRATPFLGELCDCHNRRKDGLDDLDMKFKLSELRVALCLNLLTAGTEQTLCLIGNTNDGAPINVCDCIIVDRPGGGTPGPGGG